MLWDAARPYRLWLPLGIALAVLLLAFGMSPDALDDDGRHAKFAPLFGTGAQVIATLFVALAIEARYVVTSPLLAVSVLSYVGVGLTAAVVGGSPSLPGCLYGPLLAFMLSGGAGALASTLLIAGERLAQQRADNLSTLEKSLGRESS